MRHIEPKILKMIKGLAEYGQIIWIKDGRKHAKLVHQSGDWIPLSGSPSDVRAIKNFSAQLKRFVTTGHGFITAKSGDLIYAT